MLAAHRKHQQRFRAATRAAAPDLRPQNVEAVLSIGATDYFMFAGHLYRLPPLSYDAGIAIQEQYGNAMTACERGMQNDADPAALRDYRTALTALADILWRHCQAVGWRRRWLYRLHVLRNPFRTASEADLRGLADFFVARRMKSGVQYGWTAMRPRTA